MNDLMEPDMLVDAAMAEFQDPPVKNRALMIVVNYSEAIDVFQCSEVLRSFGMEVILGSFATNEAISLKNDKIYVYAHVTFQQALQEQWRLIVLPGGTNEAVVKCMESEDFVKLIRDHVETNLGILAACGAFAKNALPPLGYVDPMGQTVYPRPDSHVVQRELGNQVWTTPGLGTAMEMALAIGEDFFGKEKAQTVAKSLLYHRQAWSSKAKEGGGGEEENDNGEEKDDDENKPVYVKMIEHIEQEETKKQNESKSVDRLSPRSAFWKIIWPALQELGWTSEQGGRWVFKRPKSDTNIPGLDWFDSQDGVIQWLEGQTGEFSRDLLHQYYLAIGVTPPSVPGVENKQDTAKDLLLKITDHLFEHVAWTRLQRLGWRRVPKEGTNEPVYIPPGRDVQLHSSEGVMEFLLDDSDWCCNTDGLSIVDLFRNCQRVRETLENKRPAYVEHETKRRMPALSLY